MTTNIRHRRWVFASSVAADWNPRLREDVAVPFHGGGEDMSYRPDEGLLPRVGEDSHLRLRVFPYHPSCNIAIRALNFYREKFGFLLHGFVLMPDHVHILLTVGAKGSISEIMRDWKSYVAYHLNRLHDKSHRGPLWQRDFWEHSIRNDADFREKLNYIHQNPVRARYALLAEDWEYSSARWYAGLPSCFALDMF